MFKKMFESVQRVQWLRLTSLLLAAGLVCGSAFVTDADPLPLSLRPDVVAETTLVGTLKPIAHKGKSVEQYCGARMVLETATDTVLLRLAHPIVRATMKDIVKDKDGKDDKDYVQARTGKRVRLRGFYEYREMPIDNTIQRPTSVAPGGTERPFVCTTFVVKRVSRR